MDSNLFKALSDGSRLRIVALLRDRAYCVKALSLKLGLSEPAVSQHMKVLRDAGLVEGVKYGYYTHYRLNYAALEALGRELCALAAAPEGKKPCDAREAIGCPAALRDRAQSDERGR